MGKGVNDIMDAGKRTKAFVLGVKSVPPLLKPEFQGVNMQVEIF